MADLQVLKKLLAEEYGITTARELDEAMKKIGGLNMESMVREQEKQGKRLETLESRDGELWRKAVGYAVTAIIGVFIGYVFTQIGF